MKSPKIKLDEFDYNRILYRNLSQVWPKNINCNKNLFDHNLIYCRCRKSHQITNLEILPQIFFAYEEKNFFLNSVYLRVFQTVELLQILTNLKVKAIGISHLMKSLPINCIIVLSKSALQVLTNEDLKRLKLLKNLLIADILDAKLKLNWSYVDTIITSGGSSSNQKSDLTGSHVLHHAPDWRIIGLNPKDKLNKVLYVGRAEKLILNPGSNGILDTYLIRNYYHNRFKYVPRFINKLGLYKFHLTAKPYKIANHEPITKVITALCVGAVPIIGEWETNSLNVLGSDYKFKLTIGKKNDFANQLKSFLNDESLKNIDLNEEVLPKTEDLFCPLNHSNQWIKLFYNCYMESLIT